jgi:tetratricopeptide repeat protein
VDALLEAAERIPETAALAALTRLEWLWLARPQAASDATQSQLPGLLEQLARNGDERGLARAHLLAFWCHWGLFQTRSAVEEARLAAEHASKAGDEGLRLRALGWVGPMLIVGPWNALAMTEQLEVLDREQSPYLVACVSVTRGEIERLAGHFDEARRLTERAIADFQAMGVQTMVTGSEQCLARIHMQEGDLERARALLIESDARSAKTGERGFRSTTQALLAQVCERLGERDAACAALELCDELGAADDMSNPPITHAVRARLALASGDQKEAERWARSAVGYVSWRLR